MRLTEIVSLVILWRLRPLKNTAQSPQLSPSSPRSPPSPLSPRSPRSPRDDGAPAEACYVENPVICLGQKILLRVTILLETLAKLFPRKLFTHWSSIFPTKKKPKRRNVTEVRA